MKTPQEAAREYAESKQAFQNKDIIIEASAAFLAGDAFGYRRGMEKAYRWISVKDEWPKNEDLILAKDPDGYIDLMQGWQMKERIKPYAVDDFYTAWRPIERVKE